MQSVSCFNECLWCVVDVTCVRFAVHVSSELPTQAYLPLSASTKPSSEATPPGSTGQSLERKKNDGSNNSAACSPYRAHAHERYQSFESCPRAR